VRCGAESSKELTFLPSFPIDTIDIDRDEELGGVLDLQETRSAEVTAEAGKLINKKVSFD
jgi:hypothetical protein